MERVYHREEESVFSFQNRYGRVMLRRAEDWRPVSSIKLSTGHAFVTFEQCEQIVLISVDMG